MSTSSTTSDAHDNSLLEAAASHWRTVTGTGWRAWHSYLAPDAEKEDPRFRRTLGRLSIIGLRAIAGVCLGGALLWTLLGSWFIPDALVGHGAVAVAAIAAVGVTAMVLSFWPKVRSKARLVGLAVLAVLPILDLLGSVNVSITSGERWALLVATIILMMLVAVAALPVRPLQMMIFGSVLSAFYTGVVVKTGHMLWDGSAAAVGLLFLVMTTLTATGLTTVVYHQRLAAYRARRAARQAFEDLRDAQVRVNVSENAASQSRFAAALSHELGTPLGSLASAFDTIVHAHERELEQPETAERLQAVWDDAIRSGRESALRLKETIDRMKRLTNLDRAEEQPTDLNELWRDTVVLLSGTLERKADVELALETLPPILCRPQQIGAVFSNLLRNAAAAMNMEERGRIRVSSTRRGNDIVIEVRDNGRGMPAGQVRDIFKPSFHVGESRVATTNWGLFVCRSIIVEHGGVIEIESEVGVGTTARVVLPVTARADRPSSIH